MKKTFWRFSRIQKVLLVFFLFCFLYAVIGLIWNFRRDNTMTFPAEGGTFVEGAVAVVDQNFLINPLFVTGNNKATSVEADLARLIFAGLMKFDAETGEVVDHLADHTLSSDKKTYTFTLKEHLTWHDGESLTADDVMFTYQTLLQNPAFPNSYLRQAFTDVAIEQADDRTVTFTIPKPYKFFLTNFTVSLVPKHLLSSTPVENLQYDEFNQNPIGAGAYRFSGMTFEEGSPMVTIQLEAFPEYISGKPKISLVDFRLFPNNDLLIRNLSGIDALHPKFASEYQFLQGQDTFKLVNFTIPQYVAVFINMEAPWLSGVENTKVRLALQLATDKEELLSLVPGKRIDTPLLETDTSEWLFEFDPEKAAGALKDSGWLLAESAAPEDTEASEPKDAAPEETPAIEEEEESTNEPTALRYIYEPTKEPVYWTTATEDFMLGTFPPGTRSVHVNGYQLQLFNQATGRFSYKLSTRIGTLKEGENVYTIEFFDATQKKLDTEVMTIHLGKKNAATPPPENRVFVLENEISAAANTNPETEEKEKVVSDQIRRNAEGEPLILHMVTISSPTFYPQVAAELKKQWEKTGIQLEVEILEQDEFVQRAIVDKDYDLLLYGQNLGYNLDAFSFWHFSQAEEGSNLSKYKSFEAGVLLEEIRQTHDDDLRAKKLGELRGIIKNDAPAVFLFSPLYTMPINRKVQNVNIDHIALFPDRFSNTEERYIRESRAFHSEKSWIDFFPWFLNATTEMFSF